MSLRLDLYPHRRVNESGTQDVLIPSRAGNSLTHEVNGHHVGFVSFAPRFWRRCGAIPPPNASPACSNQRICSCEGRNVGPRPDSQTLRMVSLKIPHWIGSTSGIWYPAFGIRRSAPNPQTETSQIGKSRSIVCHHGLSFPIRSWRNALLRLLVIGTGVQITAFQINEPSRRVLRQVCLHSHSSVSLIHDCGFMVGPSAFIGHTRIGRRR